MARHWVQEMPADTRRPTWSTAPVPDIADEPAADAPATGEPAADVRPIVPAARRSVPAEAQAPEAASA